MRRLDSGFGLLIMLLLLFFVEIAAITVLANFVITSAQNTRTTGVNNGAVYRGIVGDPNLGTFGYLGDTGNFPTNLTDLTTQGSGGWNGPYVRNIPVASGMVLDAYYSPLEYFFVNTSGTTQALAIISRGPDHTSTMTASTSANPNIYTNFGGMSPQNAAYPAQAANVDNAVHQNFYTNINSLNYASIGRIAYRILNKDTGDTRATPMLIDACPGLFSLDVTSTTRGGNDRLQVGYNAGLALDELQGAYDVRVRSTQNLDNLYVETVNSTPSTLGTTVTVLTATNSTADKLFAATRVAMTSTRMVRVFPFTSASTPTTNLSITNNYGVTLTLVGRNGTSLGTAAGGGGTTLIGAVRDCQLIEARTGGVAGVPVDSWIMPYNVAYTRVISPGTVALTISNSGATYRQIAVGLHSPATIVGNVYKLETRVFNVPTGATVTVMSQTGGTIGSTFVATATPKIY